MYVYVLYMYMYTYYIRAYYILINKCGCSSRNGPASMLRACSVFHFFFTFFIQIKYTNNTREAHIFKRNPRYFPLNSSWCVYRDIISLVINSSKFSSIIFISMNFLQIYICIYENLKEFYIIVIFLR